MVLLFFHPISVFRITALILYDKSCPHTGHNFKFLGKAARFCINVNYHLLNVQDRPFDRENWKGSVKVFFAFYTRTFNLLGGLFASFREEKFSNCKVNPFKKVYT